MGCAYTIGFLVFLNECADHSVLRRRHQVLVTEEPSSNKYLPLEVRVNLVRKLTCVDELVDCFEHIRTRIGKMNLALNSFRETAVQGTAEIVRVEDETNFTQIFKLLDGPGVPIPQYQVQSCGRYRGW